jgi:hypothetical protein
VRGATLPPLVTRDRRDRVDTAGWEGPGQSERESAMLLALQTQ